MRFDVVTLFPELFAAFLELALVGKAARAGTHRLRQEFLNVNGVGQETADSILLYAFRKPVFVVDTYTKRIFSRHGFIEEGADYGSVQRLFTGNIPARAKLFNEYHALIVRLGKEFCRPRPKCAACPLRKLKSACK